MEDVMAEESRSSSPPSPPLSAVLSTGGCGGGWRPRECVSALTLPFLHELGCYGCARTGMCLDHLGIPL